MKRWVISERWQLMQQLGGACAIDGCPYLTAPLHFDHIRGRNYRLASLSQHGRVLRLRREITRGEIQLLCEIHNKQKGKPR